MFDLIREVVCQFWWSILVGGFILGIISYDLFFPNILSKVFRNTGSDSSLCMGVFVDIMYVLWLSILVLQDYYGAIEKGPLCVLCVLTCVSTGIFLLLFRGFGALLKKMK